MNFGIASDPSKSVYLSVPVLLNTDNRDVRCMIVYEQCMNSVWIVYEQVMTGADEITYDRCMFGIWCASQSYNHTHHTDHKLWNLLMHRCSSYRYEHKFSGCDVCITAKALVLKVSGMASSKLTLENLGTDVSAELNLWQTRDFIAPCVMNSQNVQSSRRDWYSNSVRLALSFILLTYEHLRLWNSLSCIILNSCRLSTVSEKRTSLCLFRNHDNLSHWEVLISLQFQAIKSRRYLISGKLLNDSFSSSLAPIPRIQCLLFTSPSYWLVSCSMHRWLPLPHPGKFLVCSF